MVCSSPREFVRLIIMLTDISWDVALAVQQIFTVCNVNGLVCGNQTANGNGNLEVGVINSVMGALHWIYWP